MAAQQPDKWHTNKTLSYSKGKRRKQVEIKWINYFSESELEEERKELSNLYHLFHPSNLSTQMIKMYFATSISHIIKHIRKYIP